MRVFVIVCIASLLLVGLNVLFSSATWCAVRLAQRGLAKMPLRGRERVLLAAVFLPSLFSLSLTGYTMWSALTCADVRREALLVGPCVHLARHLCLHLNALGLTALAALELSEVGCAALLLAILGLAYWLRKGPHAVWKLKRPSRKLRAATARARDVVGITNVSVAQSHDCAAGAALMGWLRPRCVVASWMVRRCSGLELEVALRHEFAHATRRDNLTRTLMRLCRFASLFFPATGALCAEWEQTAELLCDEAAAGTRSEALALASALIGVLKKSAPTSRRDSSTLRLVSALLDHSDAFALTRIERLVHFAPAPAPRDSWREVAFGSALVVALGALSFVMTATLHCAAETLLRLPLFA